MRGRDQRAEESGQKEEERGEGRSETNRFASLLTLRPCVMNLPLCVK